MKLRTKYILFVSLLHLVTLGLSWLIFRTNLLFFIASELLIIISIVISIRLYGQLIKPIRYMMQGVEAIQDRDFNVRFLPTGQFEIDRLIDVYNHMLDELRNERTKQEQQHFFLNKLIHTSPTGIIILDHDARISHANPKALQILSADMAAITGLQLQEMSHPLFRQAFPVQNGESTLVKLNGYETYKLSLSHFVDRGFARQFVMIEELTAEILAAEKNVYGRVIRMMAHEVNNTIGPVNSILQSTLAYDALWTDDRFRALKEALHVAMERNQNLNLFTRNFADLVKLPAPNKQLLELNKLVSSVVSLLLPGAAEKNIRIHTGLPVGSIQVQADTLLLEQALINILKNSMESIGEEGDIHITIDPLVGTLEIADTGPGITDSDHANVFSPFFSTKKDGQGIGLTLVREILTGHGFAFSLKTVRPGYTRFIIEFSQSSLQGLSE